MAASIRRCAAILSLECQRFVRDLRIIASILQGHGGNFCIDAAIVNKSDVQQTVSKSVSENGSSSILDSVFSHVLLAVQRDRRSLERRLTRRNQMAGHFEYAMPRKDIVADLDTGHWKEKGTICRHHYERVKEETEKMKKELGEAMQYTADQKEVVFLYEGEEAQQARHDGKYVVEMKKQRPSWFPKALLQKSDT